MNHRAGKLFRRTSLFILVILFLGNAKQAPAQGQKGAVSGLITDDSGAVLKGAQVTLESPVFNTISDEQGRFYINDVAAGSYTLTITYVGFAKFQQPVTVAGGQVANIDAKLKLESQNESILVTAPRVTGEAEAVNIERNSDNLVQVMPEEVIRSLPNANLADAMGRLPSVTLERDEGEGKYVRVRGTEPRLTNATIDGVDVPSPEPDVRQVKFDAIPADLVEEVQISKTLQANMEGDGIGGSVNLITKSATELPTISLGSMAGGTPIIHGRAETEETGTIGERFGPNKRFGIIIGGSYDWNGRGIDDIEPVPDVATLAGGEQVSWKDGMDIREYQYFRSRWGFGGSTDYKISEASNIYIRGFYSDFHNYGNRYLYTLTDNTLGVSVLNPNNVGCPATGGATFCAGTPPSYDAELRNPDIGVSNLMIGGVHNLTTTWFSWDVAVSRAWYSDSPYSDVQFAPTFSSTACDYEPNATANIFLPRWSNACFAQMNDPSGFNMKDITRDLGPSAQLNIEASGSGAKRYHIGSKSATIEVGGRFRNAHKFNDGYVETITPNGAIPMTDFANRLINPNYYNGGNYTLGYNPSFEDSFAFYKANPGMFTSSSTQGQDGQEYDLIEKVAAGYIMNTIDLSSRWRFIAGLRIEGTIDNVSNFSFDQDAGTISPNKFNGSYITYLPSAALKFAITPSDNLRFFYARGLPGPTSRTLPRPCPGPSRATVPIRSRLRLGIPIFERRPGMTSMFCSTTTSVRSAYSPPGTSINSCMTQSFKRNRRLTRLLPRAARPAAIWFRHLLMRGRAGSRVSKWLTSNTFPLCRDLGQDLDCPPTTVIRPRAPSVFPAGRTVRRFWTLRRTPSTSARLTIGDAFRYAWVSPTIRRISTPTNIQTG